MHTSLFPSPRARSAWRGGVRGGGQPRARSECSPPTPPAFASLTRSTLPANGREGRGRASVLKSYRLDAAIGHAREARHVLFPGGEIVERELVQMRVAAGARQDFHQLDRGLEEPRQPLGGFFHVEPRRETRIL